VYRSVENKIMLLHLEIVTSALWLLPVISHFHSLLGIGQCVSLRCWNHEANFSPDCSD